jgi:hypothetical protein
MIEYPKWQEHIRAEQSKHRVQVEEKSKKEQDREVAAKAAKQKALGEFLTTLGIDVELGTPYQEADNVGFIFIDDDKEQAYKFYVQQGFGYKGEHLSIQPDLKAEDKELFETAGIDWWQYGSNNESDNNDIYEDQNHYQEDHGYYWTVKGYRTRQGTTPENLKVWIAQEIDVIDSHLAKAREVALNSRNEKITAELSFEPKPVSDTDKLLAAVRAIIQEEVDKKLDERLGAF